MIGQTYTTVRWEVLDRHVITKITAVSPVSSLKEIREGESRRSLDQGKKRFFDY